MHKLFSRKQTSADVDVQPDSSATGSARPNFFPAGIKILHQPADDAVTTADIVFVHGLTGDREKTWTVKGGSEPWPKTLLPSEDGFSGARILTFGYDASVADWRGVVSENRIGDHAWNLLTSLSTFRQKDNTNERTLVFVCHSLGGLVCQDALVTAARRTEPRFQRVLQSTRGIIFLGTPHHGAGLANWAALLSQYMGVVKQTNSEIVAVLRRDSEVLARIQDGFHTLIQTRGKGSTPIEITCFYEELPLLGLGFVVPQDSAKIPGMVPIGIHANHMDMTKFAEAEDPGFVAICGELREWLRGLTSVSQPSNETAASPDRVHGGGQGQPEVSTGQFVVPYASNVEFVGRTSILQRLKSKFGYSAPESPIRSPQTNTRFALCGLGGVGKTQIALAYAYWLKEKAAEISVFWVHASTADRFRQSFVSIGEACQFPGRHDPNADTLALARTWLGKKEHGSWLMIIDNADDSQLFSHPINLQQYIPECDHGALLVTTRNKQAALRLMQGRDDHVIEIGQMDDNEAPRLLRARLNDDDTASMELISELCSQLEHLPLALVQAAAYIHDTRITASRYLELLSNSNQNLVDLLSEEFETVGRDSEAPRAVAASWFLSFEQIRQQNPLASEFLSIMSLFDRQAIPLAFLKPFGQGDLQLTKAVGVLKAFSLLVEGRDDSLNMHRLVQLVTRKWLIQNGTARACAKGALWAICQTFPYCSRETGPACGACMPHAQAVLLLPDIYWSGDELILGKVDLLQRIYSVFIFECRWEYAEATAYRVVEVLRARLGINERRTLNSVTCLAHAIQQQGRLEEAEELQTETLDRLKSTLGPEHLDTLTCMNNLAATLMKRGRLDEAEKLLVEGLETYKRTLGDNHLKSLSSLNNLASTLSDQGRLVDAETIYLQAVEIWKGHVGADHPSTLSSTSNLATTLTLQGRFDEAEKLETEVLESRQRTLGLDYPDTLLSMNNLAWIWKGQGRSLESIALLEECLHHRRRILGPEHADTIHSATSLAKWKQDLAEAGQLPWGLNYP